MVQNAAPQFVTWSFRFREPARQPWEPSWVMTPRALTRVPISGTRTMPQTTAHGERQVREQVRGAQEDGDLDPDHDECDRRVTG